MEYRKRCKVCGKIWCYTDEDLKQDTTNSLMGGINAIGQIASAFGGTVFHQQYFADRSENIDRKRVNRNQCPDCHSLDSEEISAEELEDYKTQESFSKVQVSINSNATTENLLTRAKLLLEDKDWASANAYCDNVLDTEPENGTAYLYKLMAELRVQHPEDLKDKAEPFDGKANYQKVMRYADDTTRRTLSGYIEYIKDRNENERLQGIYVGACNRMEKAATEADYKAAAEVFGTIATYKDAATRQKSCLEKAEQTRIETERKEAALKAKKTKNSIIIIVVLIVAAVAGFFAYSSSQKAAAYDEAIALAEADEYADAIKAFAELGNYEDSATRAETLREAAYKEIFVLLEAGQYGDALELCKDLGEYKDCTNLSAQIETELIAYSEIVNEPIIDNAVIKAAKKLVAENQYIIDPVFSRIVNIFDQLGDAQWEYLSGDVSALSAENDYYSIKTDMWRKKGWLYSQLYIYYGDAKLYLDADYGETEFIQNIYSGVDYTVTLTEEGILIISAERGDTVIECEYKRVE